MIFSLKDLKDSVKKGIINQEQLELLIEYKSSVDNRGSRLLYYGGGVLIILAMTWLMAEAWQEYKGIELTIISALYILIFFFWGNFLWKRGEYRIPGGLLLTAITSIVPLVIYGLLKHFNIWTEKFYIGDYNFWSNGKWLLLETGVLLTALLLIKKYKFPMLVLAIGLSVWFAGFTLAPILLLENRISWIMVRNVSYFFGAISLISAYLIHRKGKKAFSFWLYLLALFTLSIALTGFENYEYYKFVIYLVISLIFIVIYLVLDQKLFLIAGIFGILQILGRLTFEIFEDSKILPYIYTIIGVVLIISGIVIQKYRIGDKFKRRLPEWLLRFKPKN